MIYMYLYLFTPFEVLSRFRGDLLRYLEAASTATSNAKRRVFKCTSKKTPVSPCQHISPTFWPDAGGQVHWRFPNGR